MARERYEVSVVGSNQKCVFYGPESQQRQSRTLEQRVEYLERRIAELENDRPPTFTNAIAGGGPRGVYPR